MNLGFEHSIANIYLMAAGALAGANVDRVEVAGHLLPVTVGSMLGGAAGVAGIYWLSYLRDRHG